MFRFTPAAAGRELRRRDPPQRAGNEGLAAPRRRQRREPPRRLHRDSGEPGPVPGIRPSRSRSWAPCCPNPGMYDFVFDTPTGAKPGAFEFRFWINDTSPPSIRLLHHNVKIGTADPASPSTTRARGRPTLIPREGRRKAGTPDVCRMGCSCCGPRAFSPGSKPCSSRRRITRKRRTWRTSARCSRTRASSTRG